MFALFTKKFVLKLWSSVIKNNLMKIHLLAQWDKVSANYVRLLNKKNSAILVLSYQAQLKLLKLCLLLC